MENGCFLYFTFEKNNWPLDIISYMDTLLINTESKHVALKNDATSIFFELSEKVEYSNTILGIHRTSIITNEYFRIKNMSNSSCLRAVRFVIYIYIYGLGAKISDIPLYIIDFRSKLPIIYDCEGVVFDSISDIKKSIAAAKSIQERLELGWRPNKISYTIGQLYNELNKIADEEDLL